MAVHPYTGCRRIPLRLDSAQLLIVKDEKLLLWFVWPRSGFGFCRIAVTASAMGSLPKVEFHSTSYERDYEKNEQVLNQLLAGVGRPPATISTEYRRGNHWAAAIIDRRQSVQIAAYIDTDSPVFIDVLDKSRGTNRQASHRLPIPLSVYCYGKTHEEEVGLTLALEPLTPIHAFPGCLALDLGNTSSTLCSIGTLDDPATLLTTPDIPYDCSIHQRELSRSDETVPSVLRIETMPDLAKIPPTDRDRALNDGRFVKWEIGASSRPDLGDVTGLILGPKRVLARPDDVPRYKVASRETLQKTALTQEVATTFPAELYVARLFQIFRALTTQSPNSLALTYPTSFSQREVERLCQAVKLAWTRLEKREGVVATTPHDLIALDLDEASAAGFNTIARKFLRSPGALQSLLYQYPHGFHLLLFDCGGGTTDIALVQALAVGPQALEVRVLGRSGVRDFGGDNITEAVFKVLKYRLAEKLAAQGHGKVDPLPNSTQKPAAFRDAMKLDGRVWAQVDRLVPTRFNPTSDASPDPQLQKNALALWGWAVDLKHRFKHNTKQLDGQPPAGTESLQRALAEIHGVSPDQILQWMSEVRVTRDDVVEQIRAKVEQAVDRCNSLILTKLHGIDAAALSSQQGQEFEDQEPDAPLMHPMRQIDCVSVVGNASRFPFVQETLRDRLRVPFLNEVDGPAEAGPPDADQTPLRGEKFDFHEDQLKTSVARGAALALFYERSVGSQLRVIFPKDFKQLLPFNCGYIDHAVGAPFKLFSEGTRYDKLTPQTIQLARSTRADDPQSRANTLALVMQWPGGGRDDWLPLGYFQFPQAVEDSVVVEFDCDKGQFKATSSVGEEWLRVAVDEELYLSPVQRGRL